MSDSTNGMSTLLDRLEAVDDEAMGYILDVWSGEIAGNWRQELFLRLTTEAERYKGALATDPAAPSPEQPPVTKNG